MNSIICTNFAKYCQSNKITEEEVGVACIMHEMEGKSVQDFGRKTCWKERTWKT
jgi:hypothetical protein